MRTTQENPSLSGEWTAEAIALRKWGMPGMVTGHSDSHGLCYEVRHEDGTTGWYDTSEIEEIPPVPV